MNSSKNISAGVSLTEITSATGRLNPLLNIRVILGGNEDKRGGAFNREESFAQVQPRHPIELDVENQTGKIRSICV